MKHTIKAALALAALFWAGPTAAQQNDELPDWYYIDTTDSGTVIYARSADLLAGRSNQTAAKVWVRMDARRDRTIDWRESKTLYFINCANQTYRTAQTSLYYANGKVDTIPSAGETRFITPDSRIERVTNLLCSDPEQQPDYR